MTRSSLRLLCLWALSSPLAVFAQSAPTVQQATTFANTLAPTSPKQVVNPAGVNPTTWNGFTGTATSVPTNLGGFSAPVTTNGAYTSAKASSLSALGTQAVVDCANYSATAPTATPAQTQACAAVNFMTNQCLTPTTQQGKVLSHVGASQFAGTNCAGTYGAGAQTFNLQNQITASDSVFTVVKNLGATAPAAVDAVCATQNVVTTPAQYATDSCVKSDSTSAQTCSQFLKVSVAPPQGTCSPSGPLVSRKFAGPVPGQDWATISASCSAGSGAAAIPFTFDGYGSSGSCSGPLNVNVDMTQPQGINQPPVLGQIVPSWLVDCMPMAIMWTGQGCPACPSGNCAGQTCSATFHLVQSPGTVSTYSCEPGYLLDQICTDGQPCGPPGTCSQCPGDGSACATKPATTTGWGWAPGVHLQQSVSFPVPGYTAPTATGVWNDACTQYESSAGHVLPTPTP